MEAIYYSPMTCKIKILTFYRIDSEFIEIHDTDAHFAQFIPHIAFKFLIANKYELIGYL